MQYPLFAAAFAALAVAAPAGYSTAPAQYVTVDEPTLINTYKPGSDIKPVPVPTKEDDGVGLDIDLGLDLSLGLDLGINLDIDATVDAIIDLATDIDVVCLTTEEERELNASKEERFCCYMVVTDIYFFLPSRTPTSASISRSELRSRLLSLLVLISRLTLMSLLPLTP